MNRRSLSVLGKAFGKEYHEGPRLDREGRALHGGRVTPVADIVRRIPIRVDPASPGLMTPAGRQLEDQRLPVGVEHSVEQRRSRSAPHRDRETVDSGSGRAVQPDTVQLDLRLAQDLVQAQP